MLGVFDKTVVKRALFAKTLKVSKTLKVCCSYRLRLVYEVWWGGSCKLAVVGLFLFHSTTNS